MILIKPQKLNKGDKVAAVSLSWGGAEDLMTAFGDKSVKGIFSHIGGYESVRMLPYIDFDIPAGHWRRLTVIVITLPFLS